jgi:hypothetical protein
MLSASGLFFGYGVLSLFGHGFRNLNVDDVYDTTGVQH